MQPGTTAHPWGIDICKEADTLPASIHTPDLVPIAEVFKRNTRDVAYMLDMPFIMLLAAEMDKHRFWCQVQAMIEQDDKRRATRLTSEQPEDEPEAPADVSNRIEELWSKAQEEGIYKKFIEPEAQRKLARISESRSGQRSTRVTLWSAVSAAWTSLECLASDTWVTAVNLCPSELGKRIVGQLPRGNENSEIYKGRVSITVLIQNKFDLRSSFGTVLRPSFDFTTLKGIEKAYRFAFGQLPALSSVLSSRDAELLLYTRNLIVHKAAIVDAAFIKATQTDHKEGDLLPLTGRQVSNFLNTAIRTGCTLIRVADDWLNSYQCAANP